MGTAVTIYEPVCRFQKRTPARPLQSFCNWVSAVDCPLSDAGSFVTLSVTIQKALNAGQGLLLFTNAGLDKTRCRPGRPLPPT
jgi:hypothetical protein